VAWTHGDALWDYHGGRPALGALLVSAIKEGDWGWKAALEARVKAAPLPAFAWEVDLVVPVPTAPWKPWLRGFDWGRDLAALVAVRLQRPAVPALSRTLWRRGQTGRTESDRRRLPLKAVALRPGVDVQGRTVLLVDDVWTTGTTLIRCAERLAQGGASEIRVLTAFRALSVSRPR
jgi:predicted amidophosphoribosyltransferase